MFVVYCSVTDSTTDSDKTDPDGGLRRHARNRRLSMENLDLVKITPDKVKVLFIIMVHIFIVYINSGKVS